MHSRATRTSRSCSPTSTTTAQDGVYVDNQTEAFRAYNCMDYPVDDNAEQKAAADALLAEKAPTIAPYWSGPDPCEEWPYPATGVREPITAEGAAPIVVVGTTNDPATPYEWAVSLADQLSSGVLVTRVGEGHTGYNKGNAASTAPSRRTCSRARCRRTACAASSRSRSAAWGPAVREHSRDTVRSMIVQLAERGTPP